MKIYEIGTGYTPIPAKVAAATESIVEELTKAFLNMGKAVEIVDISSKSRAEHDLPITEIFVPSFIVRSDVSLGIAHKLKRVVYSTALAFKLKKILNSSEDEVVLHFHNQYNLFFFNKLVSKKIRSKAIVAYTNHNGVWSLPTEKAEPILKKRYFPEIEAMKKADVIFALNDKMMKNIVGHLGISSDKVIKIDNGVNTSIYHPLDADSIADIKNRYGLTDKAVILQVGSVNENKGQERAVNYLSPLLKKNRNIVYAYVGDIVSEEYHSRVSDTVKKLGVEEQVVYLEAVSPGKEMNELYNIASATVFLSEFESFGLVCTESMSAGVPVILCSDSLINFGEGCIECVPDDVSDTVDTILSSDLSVLKSGARQNAADNFSWDKIARDYLSVFAEGTANGKKA